ncbi:PHB depolymerase family esterase [Cellulomonas hominis]|uniref:PHB depolymerase family esterase n=1 Tax=Cellulomonas hominis TaxID=156981 RepID=UPI001443B760|nr:polyhydroxybutyrate depolymerase [Cellulomonas hominis]
MRHPAAALAALVLAVLAACGPGSGSDAPSGGDAGALPVGSSVQQVEVDGTTRTYRAYRPAGLDEPSPLVLFFHGYGGSAEQAEAEYGWDEVADSEGVVVAYVDGVENSFDAGSCCGPAMEAEVDDVAAALAVVEDVAGRVAVDPDRRYASGFSNGGAMTYRLACETDVFAAFGPVGGGELVDCDGAAPASLLHIHGARDAVVPVGGDPDGTGMGHPPVEETVAGWRDRLGCAPPVTTDEDRVVTSTAACPDGREVTLVVADVLEHTWPTGSAGVDATTVLWEFFAAHPR